MAYDEDELLRIVRDERQRSVGFEQDSDLLAARERALQYIKGEMIDVPSLPNRSKAVSSDVADAIETILPDLVEIFTGGEDVATFRPTGEEDVEGAQQETDYVNHVIFNENPGWLILYTMFKDALQVKTGVVKWWKEDVAAPTPKAFTGMPQAAVALAMNDGGEVLNLRPSEQQSDSGEPLFDFEMPVQGPKQRVRCAAVPPEDFTVAIDTTMSLRDTAYCAMRARPRAQDLLVRGISEDIVDRLPPYGPFDDQMDQARDTAGEHRTYSGNGAIDSLRIVETVEHYIRLVDGEEYKIYRVETGGDETVMIEWEEVDAIPFAAITPYIVTHRFYGESVADKLMEIQRIKTAVTRAGLDNIYFALNQRMEVSETAMSGRTLSDLLRNEPGVPVLSKTGNAVRAISAGPLNFDPFSTLEYFSTVAEQRAGIVRSAQGLNPDTLHDTAKGAQVQVSAAQKRTRMIARIFAETGVKDFILGVHAMLRQTGGMSEKVRLRRKWVATDPTGWGERNDMTIELGVGSAGREQDLAAMGQVLSLQEKCIAGQGGSLNGPLVTAVNIFKAATRFVEKAGIKAPEEFFTDPGVEKGPNRPPDPAAMAQQQAQQAAQAEMAAKAQAEAAKTALAQAQLEQQGQIALGAHSIEERKLALAEAKLRLDAEDAAHKRFLAEQKMELGAQQAQAERDSEDALKLAEINARYNASITVAQIKADVEALRAHADLAIQASEHQHGHEMADRAHIGDVIDEVAPSFGSGVADGAD
jgi:hypothetical protein